MSVRREYPECPRVGVGAVVLHRGRVLLVRRGGQPSSGRWSLPGGLVELGETTAEEIKKEITRGREEITRTILAEARKIIPQYGIELVDVRIKRLDYIESVREKVYARMISERKRIAAQFRSEGEGRSAEILGAMEKDLRQIRSTAYRQVQELRGRADAEATRIYGEAYGQDPAFYAFSRTLESYATLGENTTLMIDAQSDFFRYLESTSGR